MELNYIAEAHQQPINKKCCTPLPAMPAPPAIRDPFNFVFITMFLFGIASLLPWNFFITADDYWKYKFRNVSANESVVTGKTELQAVFPSYLAIASKVPYIFSLALNTYLSRRVQPARRIGWPLFGCAVLFVVTAVLVKINTDSHQMEFLGGTLAIVVLINLCSGFLQGGGTGLAGCFPVRYMAANVYGQAVGGVFATVAQILCLMSDVSPTTSALLYFILAVLTLILTQVCFGVLLKTHFYKYYIGTQTVSYVDFANNCTKEKTSLWHIFKGGWMFFTSIVLIFWVTLSIFPTIMVLVVSTHADNGSTITNKFFIPLSCFMMFNISDLIGRFICAYLPMSATWKKTILVSCLARVVFVPLFLLCNAHPRQHLPVLFNSDLAYVIFMCLFGLSNGYLTSITLTYSSKSATPENQETAGSMAAVFLGLGLMLGSVSSYATVKLL
ncbi:equilibrative nucleoside transporter 1-like isoform X2 [Ornithodoros turicata]|uniref:equilibrative nucleoside transporter 1-like isoform X2 n=1 Tax=Ornithodoros turicata TaxID=34597 RepID=UPI003139ECAC